MNVCKKHPFRAVCAAALAGIFFSTFAGIAESSANEASTSLPDLPAQPVGDLKAKSEFRVSDHIKLSFYERLDVDEDRWRAAGGKSVETPREFHERTELSGSYIVQDDGTISLPMLGRFPAAGVSTDTLLKGLGAAFNDLIGRKGFVNLLAIEHQPIYVVGPLKSPGAFPYEPGLTPLHAVALAGGLKQDAVENWQVIEAGRESEQLMKSLEKVKRLVTRSFVLKAERDGGNVVGPELIGLVGQSDLKEISSDERAQRELIDISRKAERTALVAAVTNAKSEVSSREDRVAPFEAESRLLAERVKSMQQLVDKNVVGRPMLIQAQSALSEAEDRRARVALEGDAAKDKLAKAERELANADTQTKVEIARAVAAAEQDTNDAVTDSEGALNIMKTIAATQRGAGDGESLVYEVVRRGSEGATTFKAGEMAVLEPGDLVRVRMKKTHDDSVVADQ